MINFEILKLYVNLIIKQKHVDTAKKNKKCSGPRCFAFGPAPSRAAYTACPLNKTGVILNLDESREIDESPLASDRCVRPAPRR